MILSLVIAASGATLEVGPGKAYATINSALTASKSGDVISVSPGTYTEELDLRGKNVSVLGAQGPYSTTIEAVNAIYLDGGTLEGFTLTGASALAVVVTTGSPTLRELVVQSPGTYGIGASGGSPVVEESVVYNAGHSGFLVSGGSASIRRCISVDSAKYGFYMKAAGAVYNSLSLRGPYGFVVQATGVTATNDASLAASTAGLATLAAGTFTNSVVQGSTYVAYCNGGDITLPNGIGYDKYAAKTCAASALNNVDNVDPKFTAYSASSDLWQLDLAPKAGSPMVNGGSGLDLDGSVADLGIFGGSVGAWRDRDGDGVPVGFDCDDHAASRYPGATEIADGLDQDCDGAIDEDIPVDTGTIDTGPIDTGTIDTGTIDTGDTGSVDTSIDTADTGAGADLDHDGYAASVDCGDHNVDSYPGAREIMDGVDNDCDGAVDEGTANGDDDHDGWTILAGDCDDTDANRHPEAEEVARDGVDQDCDGVDSTPRHQDNDGDGYTDDSDCDDTDPKSYPTAKDPTDGVDNDCDGLADDDALNADADGDGQTPAEGDCRDDNPNYYSGALDLADDYVDQDCSGEDNYDVDRDGNAAPASGGTDCDDLRSTTHPGAAEICTDSLDNNCDGTVNESCDTGGSGSGTDDGCGCDATPGASALAGLLLASAGILRRRVSKS